MPMKTEPIKPYPTFGILKRYKKTPYRAWSTASGQSLLISTPVKKGANYEVSYSAGGALNAFRFIYAQGVESEAN